MRAKNKGTNKIIAAALQRAARMLESKGPDELSRAEVRYLQAIREMLTSRLYANACTKELQAAIDGTIPKLNGKYRVALNSKDL